MSKRGSVNISLFLLLFVILAFYPWDRCFADNGSLFITEKMAKKAADYFITKIGQVHYKDWAGASPADPQLYTDLDGNPSVYVFSAIKDGQYKGYVTISARTDYFPMWEYTRAPRPIERLDDAVDNLIIYKGVLNPVVRDFVFLGNWDYLIRLEDAKGKNHYSSLVSSFSIPDKVIQSRSALYWANDVTKSIEFSWKVVKGEVAGITKNTPLPGQLAYVSGLSGPGPGGYSQGAYTWYRGCGPTVITMILSYYGNISSVKKMSEFYEEPDYQDKGCFGSPPNVYSAHDLHESVTTVTVGGTPIIPADCNYAPYWYTGCEPDDPEDSGNCQVCCWGINVYDTIEIINSVTADYGKPFDMDTTEEYLEQILSTNPISYYANKYKDEIDDSDPVYLALHETLDPTNPPPQEHYETHAIAGMGYSFFNYTYYDYMAIVYDTWGRWEKVWALDNIIPDNSNYFVYMAPPAVTNNPPEINFGMGTMNGLEYPTASDVAPADFTFTIDYFDQDEYNPIWVGPYWGEEFDDSSECLRDVGGNCLSAPYTGSFLALVRNNGVFDGERFIDTSVPKNGVWDSGETIVFDQNGDNLWNSQHFVEVPGTQWDNDRWDGDNGPLWGRGLVFVDDTPYPMTWLGNGWPSNGSYQATVT